MHIVNIEFDRIYAHKKTVALATVLILIVLELVNDFCNNA